VRRNGSKAKAVDTTRRNLIKATGFLGVAALVAPAIPSVAKAASPMDASLPAPKIFTGKTVADIFPVKPDIQRFSYRNTAFIRGTWDTTALCYGTPAITDPTFQQRVRLGQDGWHLEDYALANAVGATIRHEGIGTGYPDRGIISWSPLGAVKIPSMVSPLDKGRLQNSLIVKKAALSLGANLVGICQLDPRWIYTVDMDGLPVTFEDVNVAYSDQEHHALPNSYKSIIVFAVQMSYDMMSVAPYGDAQGAALKGYDDQAVVAARIGEFVRGIGWNAAPCSNNTGLSIPEAISAGLGQLGRCCLLVTPQYGPNVRIAKVITDMPLAYDSPIDFGLTNFCNNCKKCVQACPPQALPYGDAEWQGFSISEFTGVYKWQRHAETCYRWWGQTGATCGICIRVCPWSNGVMHNNGLAQAAVMNVPQLDHQWRQLDDDLGNGALRDPATFWTGSRAYGPKATKTASSQ